jgi:hypothetical protein
MVLLQDSRSTKEWRKADVPSVPSRDYVIIAFRSFHEGMNNASAENVYCYA